MQVHKLKRAVFDRNGLIIQTKESAVQYRISENPCGPDKNGYYFYALTRIDALTRKPLGKKKRISLSTKKSKEAVRKLRKIQFDLQEHSPENQQDILFTELVREFDRSERIRIRDGEISAGTHANNLKYLEKFRLFIKDLFGSEAVYLSEITGEHARKFLESIKGRREGESGTRSRQYARGSLLRAFTFAITDGKLKQNPFLETRKIKMKRKKPNPFTPEEIRQLLSNIADTNYEYRTWRNGIRFAYNTGIRNSELRRIKLIDIRSLDDGLMYVHLPITKNGEERCIPIQSEALEAYREQLENLKKQFGDKLSDDYPLFPNDSGDMLYISTVSKWITKAIRIYAPHLKGKTFHSLRKTTADQVRMSSGITIASEILGHGNEAVTERYYTTKDPSDIHKHAEALGKMERVTPIKPKLQQKSDVSGESLPFPKELLDLTNHWN